MAWFYVGLPEGTNDLVNFVAGKFASMSIGNFKLVFNSSMGSADEGVVDHHLQVGKRCRDIA
ncbi:MAG: hypothetical protein RJB40_1009, partial [Actinomycetota bacterium]